MRAAEVLDRAIAALSPERALRRAQARSELDAMALGVTGAYEAGNWDQRFRNVQAMWRSRPGAEDWVFDPGNRHRCILEILDLQRNNEVVAGLTDRIPSYAVFTGIWPQAQTSDPAWNAEAEAWWRTVYSPAMDWELRHGFDCVEMCKAAIGCRMTLGDLGFIKMRNGQLQTIEGVRIATPAKLQGDGNVVQGVRRRNGQVDGYYVLELDGQGMPDPQRYSYVKRDEMWFLRRPAKRFDQVRGTPDLAPVVPKLRDYDETDLYQLNAVKIDAMQMLKRKLEKPGGAANSIPRGMVELEDSDGKKQRVERHDWGMIHNLGVNEDIESIGSNKPNAQYVGYLQYELQVIASAVDLPVEYLLLMFTRGSFSAQIAAKLHAAHTFRGWHRWLVGQWLHECWCWRIGLAMARGELPPAPVDATGRSEWDRVQWPAPPMDSLRPDVDERVLQDRFNIGGTSLKAIAASRGENRDRNLDDKEGDFEAAIVRAERLNQRHKGANVSWRDFITSQAPGQVSRPEGAERVEQREAAGRRGGDDED